MPVPAVGMLQQAHQSIGGLGTQVQVPLQRLLLAPQPEDTPRSGIDLALVVLAVGDVVVVEVADQDRAVGGVADEHGAEGEVAGGQHLAQIAGLEGGPGANPPAGDDEVVKRVHAEERVLIPPGNGRGLHHGAEVGEPPDVLLADHFGQVPEAEGIAGRTEFVGRRALHQVHASLQEVPAAGLAAVVPGEEPAGTVHLQTEVVASALGEEFEAPGLGVIAPDHAALIVDGGRIRRIDSGTGHVAGGGAALGSIEPTVHSPDQSVGDGVGVLQAESLEVDRRRPVRDVVEVPVGIEEQVRGVHHPHPAAAAQGRVGHVQAVPEDLVAVVSAVAGGVLVDGDQIAPAVVTRGSRGHLVVMRAVVAVPADHLESRGKRVLPELGDPEAAAGIEAEVRRLRHQRFRQHQIHHQIVRRLHLPKRIQGRQLGAVHEPFRLRQHAVGLAKLVEGRA